jgi:glutamyl-tRNA synthetase
MAYNLVVPSTKDAFFPVMGALLCQKVGVEVDIVNKGKQIVLTKPDGAVVNDYLPVALALFEEAQSKNPELILTGNADVLAATNDIINGIHGKPKTFPDELKKWDERLGDNTYLFNNSISMADLALFAITFTNSRWIIMFRQGVLDTQYKNFARMYNIFTTAQNDNEMLVSFAQEAYQFLTVAKQDAKSKAVEHSKQGSFDVDLPGAEMGKVVTRFPPEPSGYLHIGHVKALISNSNIAKMYQGTMLLRFDDTNPTKEKHEYTENIMKDILTLDCQFKGPTYTSDMIPEFYDYGRKFIQNGYGYCDDTPVDQMRHERLHKIEAKSRNNSVEENLRIFEEMIKGSEEGLRYCVRAKIDMQSPVGCMRDPTMFRCNQTPHPRHGTKFICYPMYDFACPIIDSVEGVTHTLRTIEYHDRNEQYYWVLKVLGLRQPVIWDFSRLNFKYTLLSKRKLQWFVDQGLVEGWFDPRFPTVQGILRRGLSVEALKEFMISQGASKNINLMEWDKIWALNKSKMEPKAPRYNAVLSQDLALVEIEDVNEVTEVTVPLHQKNADVGNKQVVMSKNIYIDQADAAAVSEGEEVTIMGWGNMFFNKIEKDSNGKVVKITAKTHLEGDFKKTKFKLTWVGAKDGEVPEKDFVPLTLTEFGPLIRVEKLEEDQKIEDFVNKKSKEEVPALGEHALASLKKDDVVQIQRKGFYRVDAVPAPENNNRFVLIYIPDGSQKGQLGIDK